MKAGIRQHAADRMEVADCRMGSWIAFFQDDDRVDRALQVPLFRRETLASRSIWSGDHGTGKWLLDPSEWCFSSWA